MPRRAKHSYLMIDSTPKLEKFAGRLEKQKIIGVDLEADSMYHFKEKVCLIQIATKRKNLVLDPLEIQDMSPLQPIFLRRDILKIFHGADYDIRSLYRDFKIKVNNLFDTELASRFLGFRETGLEAVLNKYFNIELNKKYQKKDWSKRPLPQAMLDYAARDALYLVPLANMLEDELRTKDRLFCVEEECERLSKVRVNQTNGITSF